MFDVEKEERTLKSYVTEARRMIGKWGPSWMLMDNDSIGSVATAIAKAEYDYDPSRGAKRATLRITYGRNQIFSELRSRRKWANRPKHFSIEAEQVCKSTGERYKYNDVEDRREPFNATVEQKEETQNQKKFIDTILRTESLTKKQRLYLELYFLKEMSTVDMAKKFQCSKQAISQVVNNGLHKLRKEFAT
jgi:RNA polymerase sigma factor (sigma-70 family)